MSWCKDGLTVKADYLGHEIAGLVLSSRVKYGGSVQYPVQLDEPLFLRWRDEPTDNLLIDDSQLLK